MNDSILDSIKKLIGGIPADYENFDEDVITEINMAFARLFTLGVGPLSGFSIQDNSSTWNDFMDDTPIRNLCKTYVQLKVRLVFDTPTNSAVLQEMKDEVKELEWVLNFMEDVG